MNLRLRLWGLALIALVSGILSLPESVRAGDPLKDIVKKVEARYKRTTDLTADFAQTTTVKGFTKALESSGRLYLKRPGKLRWDYLAPTLEQIFVDNDRVQFYVPEHKQVLTGLLSKMTDSQAPLQLLQGVGRLDAHYRVAPAPSGAKGDGGLPLLALTPLAGGPDQPKIVIEVDATSHFLRRVELHDVSGNVSNFVFTKIRANSGLKDEMFVFTVPKDVEVVAAPTLAGP
jgi:outer membrane lipoprotein carrier protein